ncbi:MAG TPA: nucleotidyltransferase family protein [Gammaproteobacteria bacterium]
MTGGPAVPPLPLLAATLRKTTEGLAHALARPSAPAPSWSDLEWRIARCVAAIHGVAVPLAHALEWRGPRAWEAFLAEQHAQAVRREARIDALVARLDEAARGAGIACVALKGAAVRALGLYRRGERPMGDVDLLVRAEDRAAAIAAIRGLGYVEAYATRRHAVYRQRLQTVASELGEHVDNPLNIELHTAIGEPLPVRVVDITERLWPPRPRPGLNLYADESALLLHLVLHAAGNVATRSLRLIQLRDIALLAARCGEAGRAALRAVGGDRERAWWAYPPLALAARYHPGAIADDWLVELRGWCPPWLRRAADRRTLTDVSLSNPRIHALPAIAWSRTPRDALAYVRSRAVPSRTARAELERTVAARPELARLPWYDVSQIERIARWLWSRPPRVQTIASVAAALEISRSRSA